MANKIAKQTLLLDDEEWEKLETLSGLDYSLDQIALYFGQDKTVIHQIAKDPESKLSKHLEAGKLKQRADEHMGVYRMAMGGDVPAFKALDEIRRTRLFKISLLDIFGGFDSKSGVNKLRAYLNSDCKNDLSMDEQIYLDALRLIRDMDIQYGKRRTIEFLHKQLGLTHDNAKKFYVESFNLFNHDEGLDKQALRNKYADNMDFAALHVKENATTNQDWKIYKELNQAAYEMRQLHKDDVDPLDPDLYIKPYTYYSLSVSDIGMSEIDRNEVARQVDTSDLPSRDKDRLREDAQLIPIDIKKRLEATKEDFSTGK